MSKSLTESYHHIFGPVPSRRLGMSLGIDLMPHKTCSLDCVYCECGKTTHLTTRRKAYTRVAEIRRELDRFLGPRPPLDFITFSGSGEPTLHSDIGRIIQYLKTEYAEYAVALLTNGTLFYDAAVRRSVLQADRIVTSFDAASEAVFQAVNRPHPSVDMEKMIRGLTALKNEYAGQLWLEIFVVPGWNDHPDELDRIQQIVDQVQPDEIQINTLDRPGTEDWVRPVEPSVLKRIQACMHNIHMIDAARPAAVVKEASGDLFGRIRSMIRRRPCTVADICKTTAADMNKINQHLDILLKNGEVEKKIMPRGTFFSLKQ